MEINLYEGLENREENEVFRPKKFLYQSSL